MSAPKIQIPAIVKTFEYALDKPQLGIACGITGGLVSLAGLGTSITVTVMSAYNLGKGGEV